MATDPIIQLLIQFLTKPQSDFYLSKVLMKMDDPKLEPFTFVNLDLGTQTILGLNFRFNLPVGSISGIPNLQIEKEGGVPRIIVDGNNVKFWAEHPNTEAPPPGVPDVLTMESDFVVTPEGEPPLPQGHIQVLVNDFKLIGDFEATSPDGKPENVVIAFNSFLVEAAATSDNIKIKLTLDSTFTPFINQILNSPAVLQRIVDGVKGKVNSPDILRSISEAGTQAARSALKQIGG